MDGLTIHFLGTSARFPVPRWGCDCLQCAYARHNARGVRSRSSLLVNHQVLVDPGPDIHAQLAPLSPHDLAAIRCVVITHPHADHHLGLHDLAQLRHLSHREQIPVWAQSDSWPSLLITFNSLVSQEPGAPDSGPQPFIRRDMALGQPFEPCQGLILTPFDTFHSSNFTTAGLLIEQGCARVVYAPDFYDSVFWGLVEPDLLILDGTCLDRGQAGEKTDWEEELGRHLPVVEGIRFARAIRARRTLFSHIGHLRITPEELCAYFPDESFSLAYDGQVIELPA